MNKIILYGPRGGSSLRPHWALAEAGLEYEHVPVNMQSDERKRPEFLKMNPMGQVPVFIDSGVILTESVAIVYYIAKQYKPELLGKTTIEEAQALRWSMWGLLNPQKNFLDWAMQKWNNTNDEAIIAKAKENLKTYMPMLDAWLAERPYIAGDSFTFGDISVAATMLYSEFCGFDYSSYTNIARWMSDVTTRPAFKSARGKEE